MIDSIKGRIRRSRRNLEGHNWTGLLLCARVGVSSRVGGWVTAATCCEVGEMGEEVHLREGRWMTPGSRTGRALVHLGVFALGWLGSPGHTPVVRGRSQWGREGLMGEEAVAP